MLDIRCPICGGRIVVIMKETKQDIYIVSDTIKNVGGKSTFDSEIYCKEDRSHNIPGSLKHRLRHMVVEIEK